MQEIQSIGQENNQDKADKKLDENEVNLTFEEYEQLKLKLEQLVKKHVDDEEVLKQWKSIEKDQDIQIEAEGEGEGDKVKEQSDQEEQEQEGEQEQDENDVSQRSDENKPDEGEGDQGLDPEKDLDDELDLGEDLDPVAKLQSELEQKQAKLDDLQSQVQELKSYKENKLTKQEMMQQLVDQYDPLIKEMITKNLVGSDKILNLYTKVRKSREKIDQVLQDSKQYQKEFETIQVNKRCRPLKLKVSRKIMQTRLDSYKNYLIHLQTVIDGLEKQIRQFRLKFKQENQERKRKNLNNIVKNQGSGGQQKYSTQADMLKKKISVLEEQIKNKLKGPTKAKKKSVVRNKSRSILNRRKTNANK